MTDTIEVELEIEEGTLTKELCEVIEHRFPEVESAEVIRE